MKQRNFLVPFGAILVIILITIPLALSATFVVVSKCDSKKVGIRSGYKIVDNGECFKDKVKFSYKSGVQIEVSGCGSKSSSLSAMSIKLGECIPTNSVPIFKQRPAFIQVFQGDKKPELDELKQLSSDEPIIGAVSQNTNPIPAPDDEDEPVEPSSTANEPATGTPGKKNGRQGRGRKFENDAPWLLQTHTCNLCKKWLSMFWKERLNSGKAGVEMCSRPSFGRGPAYHWCNQQKQKRSGGIAANHWESCRSTVTSLCETELGAPWAWWFNYRMRLIYNGQVAQRNMILRRLFHNICASKNLCGDSPKTSSYCFWSRERLGMKPLSQQECMSSSFRGYFKALETTPHFVGGRKQTEAERAQKISNNGKRN